MTVIDNIIIDEDEDFIIVKVPKLSASQQQKTGERLAIATIAATIGQAVREAIAKFPGN